MKQDINWLLEQWGIWARQDGTSKLEITSSPVFAGLIPHSGNDCLMINDDTAMKIEGALSILKIREPVRYVVLVMRYYYNMTTSSVAGRLKHGRPKIREIERAGESFVDAILIVKK